MALIDDLFAALEEGRIAREVALLHDEARMSYVLHSNTVDSFEAFYEQIGDYYTYHHARCVSKGGSLSRRDAIQEARMILEREYERRGGNIVTAFNDAHDGINAGLRGQLDRIADTLKTHAIERYTRHVFDTLVAPNAWSEKIELVRQFLDRYGAHLGSSIQLDDPARYAASYDDLIRAYVEGLQRTSSVLRRT